MLDTVVMTTEYLTEPEYQIIQAQLQARSGVETVTGEVKYLRYVASIAVPTTGSVLRFTVDTAKWVKMPGEKQPYKVQSKSFRVEGSVHKAMHGHNVYGGETDPQAALCWLLSLVADMLSCPMPALEHWCISRADYAASFDLGSLANVRGWIRAKSLVVYPRREMEFFSDLGFRAVGTTTTLKCYAKGPQFHKEGGYQALLKCSSPERAFEVSRIAERTLRCEIEMKAPLLTKESDDAEGVSEGFMRFTYEHEWRKLLRPIDSDSRMVHTSNEVASRLKDTYPDDWKQLFLVWCALAIQGESWYRKAFDASTFRKNRVKLDKAAVSWENTNILKIDSPESLQNFFPSLSEHRRMDEILPYERVAS